MAATLTALNCYITCVHIIAGLGRNLHIYLLKHQVNSVNHQARTDSDLEGLRSLVATMAQLNLDLQLREMGFSLSPLQHQASCIYSTMCAGLEILSEIEACLGIPSSIGVKGDEDDDTLKTESLPSRIVVRLWKEKETKNYSSASSEKTALSQVRRYRKEIQDIQSTNS